jgi:hypothetical protein
MNKILNTFNVTLFILLFSTLFLQTFFLEGFYYYIYEDNEINIITHYLRGSEDLSTTSSLNNSETRLHSQRSYSSFSYTSSDVHCSNFIDKYKEASSRIFNKIKNNIKYSAKHATHKDFRQNTYLIL